MVPTRPRTTTVTAGVGATALSKSRMMPITVDVPADEPIPAAVLEATPVTVATPALLPTVAAVAAPTPVTVALPLLLPAPSEPEAAASVLYDHAMWCRSPASIVPSGAGGARIQNPRQMPTDEARFERVVISLP
jgi:hypothetical protein